MSATITEAESRYQEIAARLEQEEDGVVQGKMMSSPGLKYRDKVFAFYHKEEMVFKLGKGYDPASAGITEYSLLNPFKSKPPLAGWFQIPVTHQDKWEQLARQALQQMRVDLG